MKYPHLSRLFLAFQGNKNKDAAAAIAAGDDVNEKVFGSTLLFHSIAEAKPDFVELFLKSGADWKRRDRETGWTPIMMASINCNRWPRKHFTGRAIKDSRRIVEMLTSVGATDPELKFIMGSDEDQSALVEAIRRLKPAPDAKVLNLDGSVVLMSPRMLKKELAIVVDALDSIETIARQRKLTRVLQALAEVNVDT